MRLLFSADPQLLLSMPSGMEWMWIILIVLLLFGGRKLPELARGLGKGIREFNDAKQGVRDEMEKGMKTEQTHTPPPPPSATASANTTTTANTPPQV